MSNRSLLLTALGLAVAGVMFSVLLGRAAGARADIWTWKALGLDILIWTSFFLAFAFAFIVGNKQ